MTVFSRFSLHAAALPFLPLSLPFFLFYFYFSGPTEAPTPVHSGISKIYHRMFRGCRGTVIGFGDTTFLLVPGKMELKVAEDFHMVCIEFFHFQSCSTYK